MILGAPEGTGPALDASFAGGGEDLDYLNGRTLGDLLAAEQEATFETLVRFGRPVRTMRIARADGATMGALMMHFMLETIIMGLMLGLDPFDQPAVEQSKILTREYLETM
jgi:glucose-6-phosphate isomerase